MNMSVQFGDGPEHKFEFGCFWPILIGGLLLIALVIL